MGTNFYGRVIPTKSRKEEIKKCIDENDFGKISELYNEMYSSSDEYTMNPKDIYGIYHLGKRCGGWKFLLDANLYRKYVEEKDKVIMLPRFVLTKQGLLDFLKSNNMIVVDEYNLYSKYDLEDAYNPNNDPEKSGLYNPGQFLDMVDKLMNNKDLVDSKTYNEKNNKLGSLYHEDYRSYKSVVDDLKENLPYLKDTIQYDGYSDFYNDGLRWSCFSNFD